MSENYLIHYGVLGMKWGIRRYQNPDGSLTPEGKRKYYVKDGKLIKKSGYRKAAEESYAYEQGFKKAKLNKLASASKKLGDYYTKKDKEYEKLSPNQKKLRTALIYGASFAATAAVAFGAYKVIKGSSKVSTGKSWLDVIGDKSRKKFAAELDWYKNTQPISLEWSRPELYKKLYGNY